MHSLKVLFALTAATALTACGGGGSDSTAPSPTPAPVPVPVPAPPPPIPGVSANGTLLTSVPAATYADARRLAALNQLNTARQGAGAGLVAQSAALDASASNHARYLTDNNYNSPNSPHDETSGLPDYTGANPFSRMQAQGYNYSFATEVIGDIGSSSASSDCVGDLLDTVYHAASMLSRVTDVGFGYGSGSAAGMCTIDMASPLNGGGSLQIPGSGAIVAYPYDGAVVPHGTFHVSNESPRVSMSLISTNDAGVPILVGFRNQDVVAGGVVSISQFTLATSGGTAVPGVILGATASGNAAAVGGDNVNADANLDTSFAAFVPKAPLAAGTYKVTLHATVTGGTAIALTSWSFTVTAP